MKQLFLSVALALSATAFAQLLEVESVTPLKLQGVGRSVVTGVSPKGDFLLLSDAQLNGLAKYDLSTNRIEVISQARSAGLNVDVSADGSCVAYREDSFNDRLRYTDVKVRNFATGTTKQLLKGARNVNGVSLQGNTAVTVANGEAKTTALTGKAAKKTAPVASIVNRRLVLTTNGTSKTLLRSEPTAATCGPRFRPTESTSASMWQAPAATSATSRARSWLDSAKFMLQNGSTAPLWWA